MKKTLLLSLSFTVLVCISSKAQQLEEFYPGKPCKSQYYQATDPVCEATGNAILDTITFTGSSEYTYVNTDNLELFTLSLDEEILLEFEEISGVLTPANAQINPAYLYFTLSPQGVEELSIEDVANYYEAGEIYDGNGQFSTSYGSIIIKIGSNYEFLIPISMSTENVSTLKYARARNFKPVLCMDGEPELIHTFNYTYNSNGDVEEFFYESARYNLDYTGLLTYDDNNNWLTFSHIDTENKRAKYKVYTYNEANQPIYKYHEYYNTEETDTLEYNENGQITYHKFHYYNTFFETEEDEETFYEYAPNGDVKKIRFIDQYGGVITDSVIEKLNDSTYRFLHTEVGYSTEEDTYEREVSYRSGAFKNFEMQFSEVYVKSYDNQGNLYYYGFNEFNENKDLILSKSFYYDEDPNGYLYSSDSIVYTFETPSIWSKREVFRYDNQLKEYAFVNMRVNSCFDDPLGINDLELAKSINIYPNPIAQNFSIESEEEVLSVTLLDLKGNILFEWNRKEKEYTLPKLKSGIYLAEIETERAVVNKKVMVE